MARIFISYRREDSPGHAGRLFDGLRAHFGADSVFMDVADIEAGIDFAEAIDRAVSSADVLLAVVGPKWLTCTDRKGRRRLDDPSDFIRLEIASALSRKLRVVPVLVEGADVPAADALPDDLKPLSRRQAVELRDTRWDADVADLITALEGIHGDGRARGFAQTGHAPTGTDSAVALDRSRLRWRRAAAAVAVLGLGLAVAALWWWRPEGGPSARRIVVPLVVGQPLNEAILRLESAGLATGPRTGRRSPEQPPGRVLEQSPSSGAEVSPGTAVALTYAESSPLRVPDVGGKSLQEAQLLMASAGLKVGVTTEVNGTVRPGTVLRQAPVGGSELPSDIPPGRLPAVLLVIAGDAAATGAQTGPNARGATTRGGRSDDIDMPDFVGRDVREAADAIHGLGLTLTRRISRSAEAPPYQIVRQEPAARTRVPRGTSITLVYALPPPPKIPDVVGRPLDEARTMLADAKIEVGRVTYVETRAAKEGSVTRQSPQAGGDVGPETSVIDLVVARAPSLPLVYLYYYVIEDRPATEDLSAYLRRLGLPVRDYRVVQGRGTPASTVAYPNPDLADLAGRLADAIHAHVKRTTGQSIRVDPQLQPSPKPSIYVNVPLGRKEGASSGWTLRVRRQLFVKPGDVVDLDGGQLSAPPKADVAYGTSLVPLGRASLAVIRGSGVAACAEARFGRTEAYPDKLSPDESVCVRTDLKNMSVLHFSRDDRSGLMEMNIETWVSRPR